MSKLFKVWNYSRELKKMVMAENLDDLVNKGAEKLGLEAPVRVVTESDGTDIDEDQILMSLDGEILMILATDEEWKSQSMDKKTTADEPIPMTEDNIPNIPEPVVNRGEDLRVTLRTPLPRFSESVTASLASGEPLAVWRSMIEQASDYYIKNYPSIGSKSEYQAIGKQMIQTHPCIAQNGSCEWNLFTSNLSQRIRHIRWKEGKKTSDRRNPNAETNPVPSKKRAIIKEGEPDYITEEEHDRHLTELATAWKSKKSTPSHIQMLLKETFHNNQRWIKSLPDGKVSPVLEKISPYEQGQYIVHDFKLVLGVQAFANLQTTLPTFCDVIDSLREKDDEQGCNRLLHIVRYIEDETKIDRGKGVKTCSIIKVVKDVPDAEIDSYLKSKELVLPHLVLFLADDVVMGGFVVCDGTYINCGVKSINAAFFILLASYYVFDMDYPRIYSQLLGIFQDYVIRGTQYAGIKSAKYIKFATKVKKALCAKE